MPIDECLARIARTGYSGIDESSTYGEAVNSSSVTKARRAQIVEATRQHKLRVEAIVTHADLTASLASNEPLDLCQAVDLAVDLKGELVTFHLGGSVKGASDEATLGRAVDAIQKASSYGDARHIVVAIDLGAWPAWIVKTPDDLARLFDAVGSETFGVNFDPSYLALAGIDPVAFAGRFAARIRHAHLKDHIGLYPRWQHRIPGEGELDYAPILGALNEARFKGSLAVECFTDMKFEDACDAGYAALVRAAEKAGVRFES
jgi:sugar phosphate isomerase/epimerase